jgi:hypothetical protein
MPDNVELNPGALGATVRTKDRAGVEMQIVGVDINAGGASEVLGTANALSDATSNPVAPLTGAMLHAFNGTSWDRVRGSVTNGLLVDVSRMAALPAGANNIGSVSQGGSWSISNTTFAATQSGVWNIGSITTLPSLPTGANVIGGVTQSGTWNIGSIATLPALATGANAIGSITNTSFAATQATPANLQMTATPIAITKGTQGATGFTTQDLKDAGRSSRTITLDAFAVSATGETLNTMSYSADNATPTTGTSYAVTAGKRFRCQKIIVSQHTITGNTTAVSVIVRMRVNNAGAAVVSSPVQLVVAVPGVAGANGAGAPVFIDFPDGREFVAGAGIGFTTTCAGFVTTTSAPNVNITLTGYEY